MPKRTKLDQDLKAKYGFRPSTLEDIDTALLNFVNNDLNIFCDTNDGFQKVPVIFASPERAYQIKDDPNLRPNGRTLEYPLISIIRGGLVNNPENKGKYGVYIPPYYGFYKKGGTIPIARRVNQEKSSERANLTAKKRFNQSTFPFDNQKVVYDTLYIPMPTYVEITYEIKLISDFQQQMNQMIEALMGTFSTPVAFKIEHEGNVYEAFGDETFTNEGNNAGLDVNERIFKSATTITVLGYIIGSNKNDDVPTVIVRESAAEVTIGRERVVLGDEPEFHAGRKDKYRS
tara:strand:+ start:339 stop:1202 length:864 start_codon:yes stop_codon:yes gene_type:complete